jgi:chromosome partitioning protein
MTKVGVFLAKIVAIVNQKGGVGKTTTCVNLTSSLKEKGNRVLLCDFDPQANSTSGMGVDKAASRGVYDVLINGADVTASVAHTRYGDVLPSSKALAGAGIEMIDRENREFLLKQALDILSPNYDFILIDCPPSLELLTVNALCAANSLIVPVQGEYFALEGLSDLMHTVRMVRRNLNPGLELEGVLLTMYDSRLNLTNQVVGEIKKYFADKVFRSTVPRSVRISEAPSYGEPICYYDKANRGALAYQRVAEELLERNRK